MCSKASTRGVAVLAATAAVAVLAGALAAQEAGYADRGVAVPIRMGAMPEGPPRTVLAASWDTADGWGDSGLAEDAPLSYRAISDPARVREGAGAVAFTFRSDLGATGMKYFRLPGSVAGSDGLRFRVLGDGSGATLQVRLSQSDWSAFDTPLVRLDFTGWREVVVLKDECNFHNWGGHGQNWGDIRIFALRMAGKDATVVVDDLAFTSNTAALKVEPVPAAEPITLTIDAARELPPVPAMLKGVDFALINWGAGAEDMQFGPRTEELFRQSGAKLVRFWTYCPPLNVSPAPGEYDWTRFDAQMRKITDAGAATIMTCCFTPTWLSVDGTKEGMPKDWQAYERLIADTVRHCNEQGFRVAYWEVWNEPNLPGGGFLKGDVDDLNEIYAHFVKAVRAADPEAKVGGAGLASPDFGYLRAFLDHAAAHDLPVDFVSWHVYDMSPDGLAGTAAAARRLLAGFPRYADAELVIDEWNAYGGPENAYDTEFAAAYQAAALHGMLAQGADAQTFFAFSESTPREFVDGGGRNWGMITSRQTPKASYHSFRIFAELTGPRLAVSGGEREVNAVAARGADGGIDVMLYRFAPEANAQDRTVHLALAGGRTGPVVVTLELVDDAHSNAYRDRGGVALAQVGRWSLSGTAQLADVPIRLRPLSVARVRIAPAALPAGQTALPAGEPPTVFAGGTFPLPLEGTFGWTLPEGWSLVADAAQVQVPRGERRERLAHLVAVRDGRATTAAMHVAAPGVEARTRLLGEDPWQPGTRRAVEIVLRNLQPVGVTGSVAPAGDALRTAGEPAAFDLPPGGRQVLRFEGQLADDAAEQVRVWPRVEIRSLGSGEAPLTAAYPRPLEAPRADERTVLLSTLASPEAVRQPAVGPGGQAPDGATFAPGRFGQGILLNEAPLQFDGLEFPTEAGTLELWVTPRWDGPSAPGWGTLLLRSGAGGWERSMWDLRFDRADDRQALRWSLHEENGQRHDLSADVAGWQAGQPHHVMITWNAHTGRLALYVDGQLADEQRAAGGLELDPRRAPLSLNKVGGRPGTNCIYGPVRLSNVERVPGPAVPPARLDLRTYGLQVRTR